MNKIKIFISKYKLRIFLIALILFFSINIMTLNILFSPAGIRQAEFEVLSSEQNSLINFPFFMMQNLLIRVLELNLLSIKLLSLIIGFFTILIIFKLFFDLSNFRTAFLSILVFLSTSHFFLISQDGTGLILSLFWMSLLSLLLFHVKKSLSLGRNNIKLFIFTILCAILAFYTPRMSVFFFATLVAILVHPKLRLLIKEIDKKHKIIFSTVFFFGITPILLEIIQQQNWVFFGFHNIRQVFDNLINIIIFWRPQSLLFLQPVVSFSGIIIASIGIFNIFKNISDVKSIFMLLLFICALFTSLNGVEVLLPLGFFILMGIKYLINHWAKIFPFNPYARFIGMSLLTIVIAILSISSIQNNLLLYKYNPFTARYFNNDLQILSKELISNPNLELLVGSMPEKIFYQKLTQKSISLFDKRTILTNKILTRSAFQKSSKLLPDKVLASDKTNDFVSFYIYQKN